MKILITGGAGYIGSVLTRFLLNQKYSITVLDNLYYKQNSLLDLCNHKNFSFIKGDVRDESLMKEIISKYDFIIPLACLVGAPICDKKPKIAKSINLDSIKLLIKLKSKNQLIIYPTTNSGYGIGDKNSECNEESPLKPVSLYGRTKVKAEKILLESDNSVAFRLATVFGVSSRMRLDLLVNDFVYKAFKEKEIVLYEQNYRRNYIHIDDVAMTFDFCIKNFQLMKGQVFNVGLSNANITKRELADKIKQHLPLTTILVSEFTKDPDQRDYFVSNSKIEKLGWKPNKNLDEGIIELINCFKMIGNNSVFSNN